MKSQSGQEASNQVAINPGNVLSVIEDAGRHRGHVVRLCSRPPVVDDVVLCYDREVVLLLFNCCSLSQLIIVMWLRYSACAITCTHVVSVLWYHRVSEHAASPSSKAAYNSSIYSVEALEGKGNGNIGCMRPISHELRAILAWQEAARQRKWPWRTVCKIDKEITTLLHNIPPGGQVINQVYGCVMPCT